MSKLLTDPNAPYGFEPDTPSLCEAFSKWFRVGAAVGTNKIAPGNEKTRSFIEKQYNAFVLGLESKPSFIHPEEDRYNFAPVDRFVEWGEGLGARLRGHTLVWHQSVPDWFFYDKDGNTVSADILIGRMKEHIKTVVSRYRGRIHTWDVCNEVIHKDGVHFRDTMWYKICGTRFIKEAYKAAHEADPTARLVLNDYLLEETEGAAETMIDLVTEMAREDVPIHGIGLQAHLYLLDTKMDVLKHNVRKLTALQKIIPGFMLEATELDMTCYHWDSLDTDVIWTDELVDLFSKKYTELFRFYMDLAEEGYLDSVVFWGTNDGDSWLNGFPRRHKNYPLLFDRDLRPKKVFYDVIALTKG